MKTQKNTSDCIGEVVEWSSSYTLKKGTILSVNYANNDITYDPVFIEKGLDLRKTKISVAKSVNDRFFILVERIGKNGVCLKPDYYCATASVVARSMNWELIK